jgi:iron-sulfur cluster insertion protein
MITVTETAISKIAEVIAEEKNPAIKLRMFVQGGGCSGMQYGFTLDEEQNDDDFEVVAGSSTILIDSLSSAYVTGAEIDYVEDLEGSRFSIKNPQAKTSCGCGSSFSAE